GFRLPGVPACSDANQGGVLRNVPWRADGRDGEIRAGWNHADGRSLRGLHDTTLPESIDPRLGADPNGAARILADVIGVDGRKAVGTEREETDAVKAGEVRTHEP